MNELSCFKAYDIRGELDIDINAAIAYRIGRAVAQHFNSQKIVVGRDARLFYISCTRHNRLRRRCT